MIAGIVHDETGVPLEGVRVYFTQAPVAVPDVAALTGADGRFALAVPAHGLYALGCSAEGFATVRRTVFVAGDDEVVDIVLGQTGQ
ncbi:MAG TPA: carboxypeptidase-like regulatory domain-containing protein [Marmoricola sp.]|nr:carboxypeptidase-like regulatory domain-containing protein [Marmoricola sp.]